jgi:hypothetical protein
VVVAAEKGIRNKMIGRKSRKGEVNSNERIEEGVEMDVQGRKESSQLRSKGSRTGVEVVVDCESRVVESKESKFCRKRFAATATGNSVESLLLLLILLGTRHRTEGNFLRSNDDFRRCIRQHSVSLPLPLRKRRTFCDSIPNLSFLHQRATTAVAAVGSCSLLLLPLDCRPSTRSSSLVRLSL